MKKLFALIAMFLISNVYASEFVEKINSKISENSVHWTAAENWTTALSLDERRNLCGTYLESPNPIDAELLTLKNTTGLPPTLDWRSNNGNWVTPVKNQANCGSCWDFSAVAQIEAWWKIRNGDPNASIDLSEQFVLSCSEGSCNGWWVSSALDFVKENGIPTENCFQYSADDAIPCSNACDNWQEEAVSIPGWGYITLSEVIVDNIKNAVFRHPVSASYTVYEDFNYYSGGVYEHVWGEELAGHAILIVGWNDAEQSWICKNSWGENWGENGYFRIKWGDSGMGTYMSFIWDDTISNSNLMMTPQSMQFSMFSGESSEDNLMIENNGNEQLEFILIDYEVPLAFHIDDYMAWDNLSWWCGDKKVGGYEDHWLQYLDTPMIDLSTASQPELTFKARWDVESASGANHPYDGWDGCNVWISRDGGANFNPIVPLFPEYDSNSLFSFGDAEQGWDLGVNIPGWTGSSFGWQDIKFTLADYQGEDDVILRFAFASDQGLCSRDDPTLLGFFVDEIKVSAGGNILLHDMAESGSNMVIRGYGAKDATWMELSYDIGLLQPAGTMTAQVNIDSKDIDPGVYHGLIQMNSNDTTRAMLEMPVQLEVKVPGHDLAVEEIKLPETGFAILSTQEIEAVVKNKGYSPESDITVSCTILDVDQEIYSDIMNIDSLGAGIEKAIRFKPFYASEVGNMTIRVEIINHTDFNNHNNFTEAELVVVNLFESYENNNTDWGYTGGWKQTIFYGAHTGTYSAHVNGGVIPYGNNMNTVMTYNSGLSVEGLNDLDFKYWTKYSTEKDKDVCYLEFSNDNTNWSAEDSVSGMNLMWEHREVNLKKYLNTGEKVWFRFRFISNETVGNFGVLIDDLEIYPKLSTGISDDVIQDNAAAAGWELVQNYPNPFNMTTTISYNLKTSGNIHLKIYDTTGRLVRTLFQGYQTSGYYQINWDGRDDSGGGISTGVYFYKLTSSNKYTVTNKMILLK